MEVINNYTATVYERVNIDGAGRSVRPESMEDLTRSSDKADHGQQVKWKPEYRISRYPQSIAKISSVPYLFSPNFEF